MARYSPQEQDNMRREASRRAREMQQRAPILPGGMRQEPMGDMLPSSAAPEPPVKPSAGTPFSGLAELVSHGPAELLSHLDSDHMLILAMMAMIYKDGGNENCDKKLLMALAYLLT